MMCAGAFVTCPGGGGDITGLAVDVDDVLPRELRFGVVSGVDEMRSTARQILRYRADFIKMLVTGAVLTAGTNPGAPEFTEDEIRAGVETARDAGAHVRHMPMHRRHKACSTCGSALNRPWLNVGR